MIFSKTPEYYLIASVIFYWYSTSLIFNPVAIVLMSTLIIQIIFRNKISGILIASAFILASTYMLFAMASELNELSIASSAWENMFFVGLSFLGLNIIMSGLMIFSYAKEALAEKVLTEYSAQ